MAEKIGILVVSDGSREAAMIDAFSRSSDYSPRFFIADNQANPYNIEAARRTGGEHRVIKGLDVQGILDFALEYQVAIDFGVVGPEAPILAGVKDIIEDDTDIKMLCPSKAYAIEGSKVRQRALVQQAIPEANPAFRVFYLRGPAGNDEMQIYRDEESALRDFRKWYDELGGECVIKPDLATAGKGVVVAGDHFTTQEDAEGYFLDILRNCAVIVEEKLNGEESSFQGFSDGRILVPLPYPRDYKRAFPENRGPNTGGMGSYKDNIPRLPFMTDSDAEEGYRVAQNFFEALKGRGYNPNVLFMPTYLAFIHTAQGVKILECNSRPGNPEIINILPVLKGDFVDLCLRMIDGNLGAVELRPLATVVTYAVPPTYGGMNPDWNGDTRVNISYDRIREHLQDGSLRIYPGSMELRGNETHMLGSRTVCAVGIGDSIPDARAISLQGLGCIEGELWHRDDIASAEHIQRSVENMERLRAH